MSKISNKILNRVEINIKDNDSSEVYSLFQDWIKLTQIQEEINIKPNIVEFDFIPGYKFHGLKIQNTESDINLLSFNFVCDKFEKI